MKRLFDKRVVLFTGKGGVGRSTITAALARAAVRAGKRVLVTEVGDDPDDYSPLARHFGRDRLPKDVEELAPGIRGTLLLARTGQEAFMRSVLRSATLAKAAIGNDAIRRLLSAGPSFREMGVFFQLLTYLREARRDGSPEYELILIDMPATGHTLSLTGLPEVLLRLLPRGPIADALREGQTYLNDPNRAAAYVVVLPETLPVTECFELLHGLERTRLHVGGIFLNRLPQDPFTPEERAALDERVRRAPVLGGHGFQRAVVAMRERARLLAGTTHPVFQLPELPQNGLLEHLGKALDGIRPLDRHGAPA